MLAGIDPRTFTLDDLEVLEAPVVSLAPLPAAPPERALPPISKRDLRQQFVGVVRMINHLTGGDMRDQVDTLDFLVRRVNELEARDDQREKDMQALRDQLALEKDHYQKAIQNEIAGYKKALRNISARLEIYRDPFDALPFSKWKNEAKGKWMLAAGETIDWAVQRADNQLEPVNAVPIAADED